MNIIPRRLARQDLDLADVFLEDTENEYIVVKEIPEVFSQGRNTFKIFGSEFLKPGIQLKIEILDRLGNTVFVQPIRYRLNQYGLPTLPYIYGSVEVYRPPINVGGAGTLTVLAELNEDEVPFDIPNPMSFSTCRLELPLLKLRFIFSSCNIGERVVSFWTAADVLI